VTISALNAQHPPAVALRRSLPAPGDVPPLVGKMLVAVFAFLRCCLVLLIACANLAGILLARGVAATRVCGVSSLGASGGGSCVNTTECVLLAAVAAAASLLFTQTSLGAIQQYLCTLLVQQGYYFQPLSPDWRVFALRESCQR
jgi:hypothetical protein